MTEQQIIEKLIKKAIRDKVGDKTQLKLLKYFISKKYQVPIITNASILQVYRQMLKAKKIKKSDRIEQALQIRSIRTLSGVAVVAVLTKPYPCPGRCAYCPTEAKMPKSYLSNEPAVMRAVLNHFDPYRQVKMRIKALQNNGHSTDKIELIVIGGTWSYLPTKYQTWFIKRCFDACNHSVSKTMAQAQIKNERAQHRIIGITLETRPDYINAEEIIKMRKYGCTRVEIGIQHLDDKVLELNKRGHGTKESVKATRLLKDAGFKICYHLMPNLPGSNTRKDFTMIKKVFADSRFRPDMLKIYPCLVTKNSLLYSWYKKGKHQPYSDKQLFNLLIKVKEQVIPYYVRINRLIRDIPKSSIVAGNKITNLRQLLHQQGVKCKCIRCREARNKQINPKDLKLFVDKYVASGGTEYFLSYEDKKRQTLYAFLRLRIPSFINEKGGFKIRPAGLRIPPSRDSQPIFPVLKNSAIIRELHTYGQLIPLQSKTTAVQHTGLGKQLMVEAEKLANQEKVKQIAVISGVGVRNYYRKLGYQLLDTYLVKKLT
ncbi:tRNA uridine(34) 5-carboxymethylaminomethyl modification radical SAM/GNAT enzyme Elp3 [Patescibacteria group bacterium]|nr:tRNA uridine(34) 5-carboxymethylaminomethyl modification radical SAM/GNAT enzyme Elp3 [Patescibacteria group bacterium]